MKQQFSGIFFYLLYLLAMIRPVFPIIEYHANYDYIANVLCENRDRPYLECNGKCYLEKQLNEQYQNHEHNSKIPSINLEDYPVSPLEQYSNNLSDVIDGLSQHTIAINKKYQDYFASILKPPKINS